MVAIGLIPHACRSGPAGVEGRARPSASSKTSTTSTQGPTATKSRTSCRMIRISLEIYMPSFSILSYASHAGLPLSTFRCCFCFSSSASPTRWPSITHTQERRVAGLVSCQNSSDRDLFFFRTFYAERKETLRSSSTTSTGTVCRHIEVPTNLRTTER